MIINDKQQVFNQVKGEILEINAGEDFSSLTLKVGHANFRSVNLSCKTIHFNELIQCKSIGDKVLCQFYISSNKKNDRWYTTANLLSISKEN
jgi:hypothetical protein